MQRISDYIKLFIQDRKVYCEDVTVQSYIFYLGRFTNWLDSDDFDLLNKQTLRDYIFFKISYEEYKYCNKLPPCESILQVAFPGRLP